MFVTHWFLCLWCICLCLNFERHSFKGPQLALCQVHQVPLIRLQSATKTKIRLGWIMDFSKSILPYSAHVGLSLTPSSQNEKNTMRPKGKTIHGEVKSNSKRLNSNDNGIHYNPTIMAFAKPVIIPFRVGKSWLAHQPSVTNLPPTFWVCPNDAQIRTAFGQIRSE